MGIWDYFAGMYVAGMFGDDGWSVDFARRDVGFDFIVSKPVGSSVLIRPVQVKGLYPTEQKKDLVAYGFGGTLTAMHPDMVLALVYFSANERRTSPTRVAFMPASQLRPRTSGGIRCVPASIIAGEPKARATFQPYFDQPGLEQLSSAKWA